MGKTLLLLLAMLIAVPAYGRTHKRPFHKPHEQHAKALYKQTHVKRPSFQSEHPKAEHPGNPHVKFRKARKHVKSHKHRRRHAS